MDEESAVEASDCADKLARSTSSLCEDCSRGPRCLEREAGISVRGTSVCVSGSGGTIGVFMRSWTVVINNENDIAGASSVCRRGWVVKVGKMREKRRRGGLLIGGHTQC